MRHRRVCSRRSLEVRRWAADASTCAPESRRCSSEMTLIRALSGHWANHQVLPEGVTQTQNVGCAPPCSSRCLGRFAGNSLRAGEGSRTPDLLFTRRAQLQITAGRTAASAANPGARDAPWRSPWVRWRPLRLPSGFHSQPRHRDWTRTRNDLRATASITPRSLLLVVHLGSLGGLHRHVRIHEEALVSGSHRPPRQWHPLPRACRPRSA